MHQRPVTISKSRSRCQTQVMNFQPRQKVGLVTLILKQDKDPKYITNLRPITLLPTFYKIASGVLMARLKPIFDRLISPWQKAYLPNRFIGDITRNIHSYLHKYTHI